MKIDSNLCAFTLSSCVIVCDGAVHTLHDAVVFLLHICFHLCVPSCPCYLHAQNIWLMRTMIIQ